jgi:hypothetical protein
MQALYLVLILNKKVHVLEANRALMLRDVAEMRDLYASFTVTRPGEKPRPLRLAANFKDPDDDAVPMIDAGEPCLFLTVINAGL